ncbi:cysteine peptidase family C39 domain-containing protein [Mesoplasma syrphidae]|uniref:cysteine peptidase family C39 domain-containing protein n=1 Tax=Mesoplasma syrphidae TaxID=225999 RepID=UPI002481AC94|nr:cysteine peptidase family C39 domain-containing protein [Mesoplasma syrphidae]
MKQTGYQECGIACLAMLINFFHNTTIDIDQIKYEQNLDSKSLNFFDLVVIAKAYFLNGEAFEKVTDFELLKKQKPFLAQTVDKQGILHFIIVSQITDNKIIINDPSKSRQSMLSWKEFQSIFAGNIIIFTANRKLYKAERGFWKAFNFKGYKLYIINYSIITFVTTIIFIGEAQFIKKYGQDLVYSQPNIYLYIYFFTLFVLNLLFKELNALVVEKLRKKQHIFMLKKFFYFCTNYSHQIDYYKIFEESKFIIDFMINIIIPIIPNTISNVICSFVIAKLNFGVAGLIFVHNFIIIGISLLVTTPIQAPSANIEVIKYITSKEIYQNSGKEKVMIDQILLKLKNNNHHFQIDWFKNFELVLDKILVLLIYWVLWFDLKKQAIIFENLIIILVLNSLSQTHLKLVLSFLKHRKKYFSYVFKLNKLFIDTKTNNSCPNIHTIKLVEIAQPPIILLKGINILKKERNFLKVVNKSVKNSLIEVFINNLEVSNFTTLSIRAQIYYGNSYNLDIWYGTLLSNLVDNNFSINANKILSTDAFLEFSNKYGVKIQSLIIPEGLSEFQKELIVLCRVLFTSKSVYIIDQNFYLIRREDVLKIIELAAEINSNLLIVFNDLY